MRKRTKFTLEHDTDAKRFWMMHSDNGLTCPLPPEIAIRFPSAFEFNTSCSFVLPLGAEITVIEPEPDDAKRLEIEWLKAKLAREVKDKHFLSTGEELSDEAASEKVGELITSLQTMTSSVP